VGFEGENSEKSMNSRTVAIALAVCLSFVARANSREEPSEIPDKAICRACEIRGSAHGEEDVAAWREFEGATYYFCSKACAEAFDGFPGAYAEHPVPRPAPNAVVIGLSGEEIRLDELEGQVVLLDFWATWCAPCLKAMPKLNALQEKWAHENFTVLGVSIDEKGSKVVPRFLQKRELDYPIALDATGEPAWYAYQVAAIPTMFLIDQERRIVAEWRGEIDTDSVIREVERLLSSSSE
jgi:thiol-disulfide isomerase/thioredoxin